jgi:hypothetical protein
MKGTWFIPPSRVREEEDACGLEQEHALNDSIQILIIQIELFIYDFFSFRFLTTEAMLPLLPCTARH